ncbi:hypothetical protein Moror_15150 [Moniliophthora roreri MCA 2997]|uniref:Uncharacterized protein n=1 Tax=Moniliophthora roreri (strain MCA 2997) TaxID=1381753 RepID=V2WIX5_MONRO|nr:hypothetical protein Moror_15150 [Moniliophthora roreri MCA 2997]
MLGLSTFFLALAAASSASLIPRNGNNTMKIDVSGPTFNVSHGTGGLSASGVLDPFGKVGLGCGLSYDTVQFGSEGHFGGGLNAGTPEYGLGGGFSVGEKNLTAGFGIGGPKNVSADSNLTITKEGKVEFTLVSTLPFKCTDTTIGGKKGIKCSSE